VLVAHKGCADNVSRPEGPVPKGCAGIARWRRYSACRYLDIDCTSRLATDRFRLQRDPRRLCRGSLVDHYGWRGLAERIPLRCFYNEPSIKSSLKFLRKTPWAREKVEDLYLSVTQR
jgi:hypothetical protein